MYCGTSKTMSEWLLAEWLNGCCTSRRCYQVKLRSRNLVTCTLLSLPWYEIKDVPIYRCKRFKFRTLGVKFRYIYCS